MLLIFSTPVLIRYFWQLKTVVFLHWYLLCALLLRIISSNNIFESLKFMDWEFKWLLFCDSRRNVCRPNGIWPKDAKPFFFRTEFFSSSSKFMTKSSMVPWRFGQCPRPKCYKCSKLGCLFLANFSFLV